MSHFVTQRAVARLVLSAVRELKHSTGHSMAVLRAPLCLLDQPIVWQRTLVPRVLYQFETGANAPSTLALTIGHFLTSASSAVSSGIAIAALLTTAQPLSHGETHAPRFAHHPEPLRR